jgi:hypothetical protein
MGVEVTDAHMLEAAAQLERCCMCDPNDSANGACDRCIRLLAASLAEAEERGRRSVAEQSACDVAVLRAADAWADDGSAMAGDALYAAVKARREARKT